MNLKIAKIRFLLFQFDHATDDYAKSNIYNSFSKYYTIKFRANPCSDTIYLVLGFS